MRLLWIVLAWVAAACAAGGQTAKPERIGYTPVGAGYFPVPAGVEPLAVPNGSFEHLDRGRPKGWHAGGLKPVEGKAPHGKVFLEAPAGGAASLVVADLPVRGGKGHLLSLWLRSDAPLRAMVYAQDAPSRFGRHTSRNLPATGGQWRRVGLYFRVPAGATKARLMLRAGKDPTRGPVAIDDVRLRTATPKEMTMAYAGWRARYPKRDLAPRPTDGAHLALTIRKLEEGLDPERPFLIWAIGSSYTNMLGMGEIPIEIIRQRFPNAPEIVYKKHVGAAVQFNYIRGWARHIVVPEQPDLVLIYTIGKAEDLDTLLAELRRGCTADILVPTIHWRMRDAKLWGTSENAADQDVAAVRRVCAKHGVELVENRREWAEHMKAHGLKVEIDAEKGLLKDAVHQSAYGALIINENIARHVAHPPEFAYEPDARERRLRAVACKSIRANERIELGKGWKADGGCIATSAKGARVKVTFQGRRIDLIGRRSPGGGSVRVLIDGTPADQVPAFYMSFINVGAKNARPKRGLVTDRAPHGAELGRNVVPQTWTITMVDDAGNYALEGTVTGLDGRGNNAEPFTSTSGQITVPPELWRYNRGRKGEVVNKKGDTFTWQVARATLGSVDFKGAEGERFRAKVAQSLENREHTLELIATDGEVRIEAFDVFEPPLK